MRRAVLIGAVAAALAAPGIAHAAPHLYRPNPAASNLRPDYVNPLPAAGGGVAALAPLTEGVVAASVADIERLRYSLSDDLGGFIPAPLGSLALSSGGRNVVGSSAGAAQIPLFQHHAGGTVNAFTFTGGPVTNTPDNGKQRVPGIGVPPPVPPATSSNNVPPANQGFGGGGGGGGGSTSGSGTKPGAGAKGVGTGGTHGGTISTGGGTTAATTTKPTTTKPKPPTTTTSATTTTIVTTGPTVPPTTTAPTTTTTGAGGGGGGGGGGGDCGGEGISITSDHATCLLHLVNAKPGAEVHEVLTIENTSDSAYTLKLRVEGSHNQLWNDLRMGVWEQGSPPPNPLPPLLFWTTQFNALTVLEPGDKVSYVIQLQLPAASGNQDMNLAAIIDFHWLGG
jgi:hypothetical protein